MKIEKRNDDLSVIRDAGFVPGVIYGHNIESTKIQTVGKDLLKKYYKNGLTMSFEVELDNETHIVFFKEIQKDPMNPKNIIHFDLMKVSTDDVMTASIPVHLIGRDEVEKKGLIVQLLSDTLDFEFPVTKGISSISVDISTLEGGDSISADAIEIPEGFELQEDPNKLIVNVTYPTIETEEEEEEEEVLEETIEEEE